MSHTLTQLEQALALVSSQRRHHDLAAYMCGLLVRVYVRFQDVSSADHVLKEMREHLRSLAKHGMRKRFSRKKIERFIDAPIVWQVYFLSLGLVHEMKRNFKSAARAFTRTLTMTPLFDPTVSRTAAQKINSLFNQFGVECNNSLRVMHKFERRPRSILIFLDKHIVAKEGQHRRLMEAIGEILENSEDEDFLTLLMYDLHVDVEILFEEMGIKRELKKLALRNLTETINEMSLSISNNVFKTMQIAFQKHRHGMMQMMEDAQRENFVVFFASEC